MRATHKSFPDVKVTYSIKKDFLGEEMVFVNYGGGEKGTMSRARFDELFKKD